MTIRTKTSDLFAIAALLLLAVFVLIGAKFLLPVIVVVLAAMILAGWDLLR
jgi:MFS superfamily sulfate permease-like transporter